MEEGRFSISVNQSSRNAEDTASIQASIDEDVSAALPAPADAAKVRYMLPIVQSGN